MKPNILLIASAAYLALVGIGLMISPEAMMLGIPVTSGALIAVLRGYGGSLMGIAVLSGVASSAVASKARDAIFLGSTVGYGLVAIFGVVGILNGAPQITLVYVIINALFAVAFFVVGKANMSPKTS